MLVIDEIGSRIDQLDEKLMTDKQLLTLETFHSIYHLKHDLLHLRILFNPLKQIIYHLQRTTQDEEYFLYPNTDLLFRLDMKNKIVRRKINPFHHSSHTTNSLLNTTINLRNNSSKQSRRTSIFLNENIYIYLNDLNDHIHQAIDSLEMQRESVSMLVSFWLNLNNYETQQILKMLMLISVLFMPCVLLTGCNSTNFHNQPQLGYEYSYYILLILLATILTGMITWYKLKQWI
jgi:Mg2+ and Co2+ transporter CorA